MTKNELVEFFNSKLKEEQFVVNNQLLSLINEYLTEINYENPEKVIQYMVQNPDLFMIIYKDLVKYYANKYTLCSIMYNNKILMYYVSN